MAGPSGISAGGDLIVDIAFFVKAWSIYPPGHSRIRAAADQLLTTVRERTLKYEDRVVLVFRKHEVFIDGSPRGVSHPIEKWLLGATRKAKVGGIEITREITLEALESFATAVVGAGLRADAPPSGTEHGPGLHVFDLSYAGRHASGEFGASTHSLGAKGNITTRGADGTLIARLQDDPEIAELVERLVGRMAEEFETSPTDVEIELIPRIVSVVTADAGYDVDQALLAIASTLKRLDQKLSAWAAAVRSGQAGSGGDLDEELARIANRIARRYFSRDVQLVVQDDANLPSGRPGDEAILDELEPLIGEMAALPSRRSLRMQVDEDRLAGHVASIWTHLIAEPLRPETPERAAGRIARLLDEHPDADLSHLRSYGRVASGTDPKASARVVSALLRLGLATQLVRHEAIGHLHLAATFPDGFADWLRALPDGPFNLPSFLGQALRAIPAETLRRGVSEMISQGELDAHLYEIMLTCKIPEMLRVFEVIANLGVTGVMTGVVDAMKRVPLPEPESSAVQALPSRWIPDSHTLGMCRLLLARQDRAKVREDAERLLRAFTKSNHLEPEHERSCVAAIEALARFPSTETRISLKQLARHPFLGGSAPRPVRRAAKATLKRIGGPRVPRTA